MSSPRLQRHRTAIFFFYCGIPSAQLRIAVFMHIKKTNSAGEDGDFDRKVEAIEEVDALVPRILETGVEVMAVTGDHSTPAQMAAHSWRPVPVLLWGSTPPPTASLASTRSTATQASSAASRPSTCCPAAGRRRPPDQVRRLVVGSRRWASGRPSCWGGWESPT